MKMKKKSPVFEPWCLYPEGHEVHDQHTQPLPARRISHPLQETSEQHYRRLKALSDATGERLLFVYLHDQGRATVADRHMMKGKTRW